MVKKWFSTTKAKVIAVGVVAGAILLFIGTLEVTSQPLFCSSCHYMKSYYDEWKKSPHKEFNCLECHSKPGLGGYLGTKFAALHEVVSMVTGKYPTRPHAEVDDANCLKPGCHEKRLLTGKVKFKRGITFDHTPHLTQLRRGKQLRCTSCHAQMVMGQHIAVAEEVCFLCHFKGKMGTEEAASSTFCLRCHKAPEGDITIRGTSSTFNHDGYLNEGVKCQFCHADVVRGNGNVPTMACYQCHNKPENIKKIGDLDFIHKNHIALHKIDCYRCHSEVSHSIPPLDTIHPKLDTRIQCEQCHGLQHSAVQMIYKGVGGRGVAQSPSSMFTAHVDCGGCHNTVKGTTPSIFSNHFAKADASGCVTCHGPDGAGYLKDWETQISGSMAKAQTALAKARNQPGVKTNSELKMQIEDAAYNIDMVNAGKGIHNVEYSQSLLDHSIKVLEEIGKKR